MLINPMIILIIGLLFILFFGGLSYIRREGLSLQFAIEGLVITLIFSVLSWGIKWETNPVFFLALLYVITFRVRILVDFANYFDRRNQTNLSKKIYQLANKLIPDLINQLIIKINQAVSNIRQGRYDEGIQIINEILQNRTTGFMGIKTEAACYYNLAIAYKRKGLNKAAQEYFQKVIDTLPASIYSAKAMVEIRKEKEKLQPQVKDQE